MKKAATIAKAPLPHYRIGNNMSCKGFCDHHPFRLTPKPEYIEGSYFCNVCTMGFMFENGPRCPCCRQTMRARTRHPVQEVLPLEKRQNASIREVRQGFLLRKQRFGLDV